MQAESICKDNWRLFNGQWMSCHLSLFFLCVTFLHLHIWSHVAEDRRWQPSCSACQRLQQCGEHSCGPTEHGEGAKRMRCTSCRVAAEGSWNTESGLWEHGSLLCISRERQTWTRHTLQETDKLKTGRVHKNCLEAILLTVEQHECCLYCTCNHTRRMHHNVQSP